MDSLHSAVMGNLDAGSYTVAMVEPVRFTKNYGKFVDLDERLRTAEMPWDLDRERSIFTKKRGYQLAKEDKEEADGRKKDGTGGTEGDETTSLEEDEMVLKKEE